ncbi:MAG: YerC/YecD family TrpR-related protein [Candidatus Beckwithbacteria bacterium]|nr:YerC/YecD family TrpR-related protein [Candidatus Beckwithbacteria bacterium]
MSNLYRAILKLKNTGEVAAFWRDLLTLKEIKIIDKRFAMAELLYQGIPYAKIAKKLHVSTTTVTRTAYWLKHGKGGYQLVLSRLKKGDSFTK